LALALILKVEAVAIEPVQPDRDSKIA